MVHGVGTWLADHRRRGFAFIGFDTSSFNPMHRVAAGNSCSFDAVATSVMPPRSRFSDG